MGPHPELDKFVGPCLISQAVRSSHRLPPPHPPVPLCTCCGGVQLQGSSAGSAWAGVPLIAFSPNRHHHHHHHPPPLHHLSHHHSPHHHHHGGSSSPPTPPTTLDEHIVSLSQLAIHAQGPPLIFTAQDVTKNGCLKDRRNGVQSSNSALVLRSPSTPRDDASSLSSGDSDRSQTADSGSVTSEDSSAASEPGLPRVIKPRKRRKRERRLSEGTHHHHQALLVGGGLERFRYPNPPSSLCRCRYCEESPYMTPPLSPGLQKGHLHAPGVNLEYPLRMMEDMEVFKKFTVSQPPQRPWLQISHPSRTHPSTIFTVMCYNVLCDKYATRQMYGYCPTWALNWEYRRKGIMDEIRHYSADIISLQEVETEQFFNFFLPELKRDGYDGIFSPKSRAKTMSEVERKHVDGCAIFFRTNKFSLMKEHLVEFNQLAMANAEGSDDMLNRVMTKDNIGLAALLQTKDGAFDSGGVLPDSSQIHQPILVCTAHIHWDPEYCDVKLIQTMMLMHELRTIVEDVCRTVRPNVQKTDANHIPLLLCGDMNSLPESGVIEFLTSGHISADHQDFKELGYKECLRRLSTNSEIPNVYVHPFKVSRAYADDIMPYTNYTFDFKGVIDYIFYSKEHMSVLGVLGPLDPNWFQENKVAGCPHPHVPSDHFPLLVQLEMNLPLPNGLVIRR